MNFLEISLQITQHRWMWGSGERLPLERSSILGRVNEIKLMIRNDLLYGLHQEFRIKLRADDLIRAVAF